MPGLLLLQHLLGSLNCHRHHVGSVNCMLVVAFWAYLAVPAVLAVVAAFFYLRFVLKRRRKKKVTTQPTHSA